MSAFAPPDGLSATRVSVFVSSTFRDMHAERDLLVTVVFPELRERLERVGLELRDVDLRWGVPEKGIDGERASPWEYCKRTLDQVEPLFLCVLGERYGSVPEPADFRDSAERATYAGLSITEMEIRRAVLDGRLTRRSYFYFRETRVPHGEAPDFVDPPALQDRLAGLKDRIRSSGRPVRTYRGRWTGSGFTDLDTFGQAVLEDLWSGVLRDERYVPHDVWRHVLGCEPATSPIFADESQPVPRECWEQIVAALRPAPRTVLEAEHQEANAFVASRTQHFHGRSTETEALLDFVRRPSAGPDASRLAVVAGPPGQGKSTLLAWLHQQVRQSSDLVISRFIGATQRSSDAVSLLENALEELETSGVFGSDSEHRGRGRDLDALSYRLALRLGTYEGPRRIVLILDALNQLTDGHDLSWLPHRLGPSVRVIVSCLDRPAVADSDPGTHVLPLLLRRLPEVLLIPLGPLSPTAIASVVHDYLDEHCRALDSEHVERICQTPQAGNPLYLLVMLEELRALGGNDLNRVVQRLIAQMSADHPDARSLFRWVLQRMEVPFGKAGVTHWCLYVVAGRVGMTSRELASLLERKLGQGGASSALRIERGLRRYLQHRGLQLDFSHGDLAAAVIDLYGGDAHLVSAHRDIAEWFEEAADPDHSRRWRGDAIRPLVELSHHLARCDPNRLLATLSQFPWLWAKARHGLVDAIVADFREAIPTLIVGSDDRRALELVRDALRTSLAVVRGDPSQLANQLLGRLATFVLPQIQELIASIESWREVPWLYPWMSQTNPALTRPGSAMLGRIAAHDSVNAVAITSDGATAVSAGNDGLVRVWDLERLVCRHTLSGHGDEVNAVALFQTPEGYVVASGAGRRVPYKRAMQFGKYLEQMDTRASRDNSIRIWDAQTGMLLNILFGHKAAVRCFATAQNFLFSGSDDGTVRIADVQLRQPASAHLIGKHGNPVVMLALLSDLLSFSEYDFTSWKPDGSQEHNGLNPFGIWHSPLAVYPSPFLIALQSTPALAGDTYHLQMWNISNSQDGNEDLTTIARFEHFIMSARFLEDGTGIVVGGSDGRLSLIDVSTGAERRRYPGHKGAVRCIDVASGARRLITGSSSGELIVWDLDAHSESIDSTAHTNDVNSVAFSGDGRLAATGSFDHSIVIWDCVKGQPLRTITAPGPVYCLALSEDGRRVVAGWRSTLQSWDVQGGTSVWESQGHKDVILDVAFGERESVVVSASLDKTVRVVDAATGAARVVFKGHAKPVRALAVVAGGHTVFSGDDAGEILVWDLRDGSVMERIPAFKSAGNTESGRLELSRSDEWPTVKNDAAVHAVAVSKDGRLLALSQGHDVVRMWDVAGRKEMKSLRGHTGRIHAVKLSSDGRRAVTASHDGAVRLWDVPSERSLATFTSDRQLLCCAMSPNTHELIAGEGESGRIHFLRLVSSGP